MSSVPLLGHLLDRLLDPRPGDPGCDRVRAALPAEAEERTGCGPGRPTRLDVARHLRECGPCGEDFAGLLAAVRAVRSRG